MAGEVLLVDLLPALGDAACSLDELRPSAVVEGDPEAQPGLARRRLLELPHLRLEPVRRAVAAADELRVHALLGEIEELAIDRLAEDLHQRGNLVAGAGPVLGRERVHGERLDACVDRRLDDRAQRA